MADLASNREMTTDAVRNAARSGARLVVLPELVTSGYVFDSADEARSVAVPPDHPIFDDWSRTIAEVDGVVVGGFAELGDDGLVYNSAAVVDKTGVIAVYRKTHLWDREKLVFEPGAAVPPVVESSLGPLGVVICYDLEFPELTRSLALRGAELIAVPTNWPRESVPAGERVPEVTVAMAAAYTNHVGIVCCDRSGRERGQDWNEASSIIDSHGWVIAAAGRGEITISAELDPTASRDKSLTQLANAFGDRRPELYGAVVEPPA
jgi:predicted amidohydrolase